MEITNGYETASNTDLTIFSGKKFLFNFCWKLCIMKATELKNSTKVAGPPKKTKVKV